MVIKKKLRKIFHDEGIQISVQACNLIDDHVKRLISRMAARARDGNVKRITEETYHLISGNPWIPRED